MSPVFTQEFVPDTQSQLSSLAPLQSTQGSAEAGRMVRASFTALGLALSLGASGSLISSAEAADSMQLAALPSVTGAPGTLPSFGSSRPEGASATYHTVADGETIWDIAKRHGVTVEDIKSANGIGEDQVIQAGQVLKVPAIAPSPTASSPSVVLEMPQEVAAASPNLAAFESSADAVDATTITEDAQTAPLDLSEFLTERPSNEKATEENLAAESASTPMAAANASEGEAVALLPESDPVQSFAAQLELPAKTKAKSETNLADAEAVPYAFQDGQMSHRVGTGETVWSIARNYGVETEVLQEANSITDPNFIVAGDELVIPAMGTVEAKPDPDIERLSRRQVAVEQQMASIAPMIESVESDAVPSAEESSVAPATEAEALAIGLETPAVEVQRVEAAIADPFVEGLMSDVAQATQSQVNVTAQAAEQYAQNVAALSEPARVADSDFDPASLREEAEAVAVNPEFANEADPDLTEGEVPAFPSEELLAAAPLGSEVYAPVIENPAGRVVTPDMPVLPGQDEYLPEAPNRFEGYIWPAQGVLTSGYGWRWGRMHRGVDIAGPVGTPIYAAAPGVVVKSGWNSGGYGNLVDIRHPDGSMTRYAHNSRLLVREGQEVRQGQQIAEMGSTGYSTGPHLHFEVHIPNQGTVNPIAMLPGR